jgi:hypothetical protein
VQYVYTYVMVFNGHMTQDFYSLLNIRLILFIHRVVTHEFHCTCLISEYPIPSAMKTMQALRFSKHCQLLGA